MAWKKRTCSRPSIYLGPQDVDFLKYRYPVPVRAASRHSSETLHRTHLIELFTAGARVRKRLARAALAAYSQCRLFLLRLSVELCCKPIGVPAAPKRAILRC